MNAKAHRRLMLAFALASACVCAALMADRREHTWDRSPGVPYRDATTAQWPYRVLDAMSSSEDHLAIWGWAAQHWVYSGMIPATRESSTEFAFLNWGPDGYYRKRYLATLRNTPPEFFLEAVGPNQFLFTDRAVSGIDLLPDLRALVDSGYRRVADDGASGVYMRNDRFDACCSIAPDDWRGSSGAAVAARAASPLAAMAQVRWTDASADGSASMTLAVHASRDVVAMLVPFVKLDAANTGFIRVDGASRPAAQGLSCEDIVRNSLSGEFNVCVIQIAPTRTPVLRASGGVSVAQPVLVHQLPDEADATP